MALIWLKLYTQNGEPKYRDAARSSVDFVLRHHDIHASDPAVRGAVKGSRPVWGRYAPLSYPNWATKFLVDALLSLREHT